MYRLPAFLIAVFVLLGLVLSGGFLTSEDVLAGGSVSEGATKLGVVVAQTDDDLQKKADREIADIDNKAKQQSIAGPAVLLPAIKPPLTEADIVFAAQRAGIDAEQIAVRVGQTAEQAQNAKQSAENFVRERMLLQMREEQRSAKAM